MFSGGIERDQWHEMSKVKKLFIYLFTYFFFKYRFFILANKPPSSILELLLTVHSLTVMLHVSGNVQKSVRVI